MIDRSYEIIRFEEVESTNTVAYKLGNSGVAHGTVVLASRQTGGKGRLARVFESPPGGLYMSMILRPELSVAELPLVTLAAGVAAAQAVGKKSKVTVQLKWPNDLYVEEKKLGGILTEGAPYAPHSKSIPFVIVGIGLNVNTPIEVFSESLQERATSLLVEAGQSFDIDDLMKVLVEEILTGVKHLQTDTKSVLDAWQKRDYLLGKNLQWHSPDKKTIAGSGAGLLPDGRYRLTSSDGDDYSVLAGDIELTEINGQQIK